MSEAKHEKNIAMLEHYENALNEAFNAGMTRGNGTTWAKETLYRDFPEFAVISKLGEPEACSFWASAHGVANKVYNQPKLPEIKIKAIDPKDRDLTFMGKMRQAADAGFIPYPSYLKPFINGKSEQISAYMSMLKNEGYEFDKDEYGWTTKKYPRPEIPQELADALAILKKYEGLLK